MAPFCISLYSLLYLGGHHSLHTFQRRLTVLFNWRKNFRKVFKYCKEVQVVLFWCMFVTLGTPECCLSCFSTFPWFTSLFGSICMLSFLNLGVWLPNFSIAGLHFSCLVLTESTLPFFVEVLLGVGWPDLWVKETGLELLNLLATPPKYYGCKGEPLASSAACIHILVHHCLFTEPFHDPKLKIQNSVTHCLPLLQLLAAIISVSVTLPSWHLLNIII